MKNPKSYLAGIVGAGSMLENGNSAWRQTVIDIVDKRFKTELANKVASGELQATDRVLYSSAVIHDGTSAIQTVEVFKSSLVTVDGLHNVDSGKLSKDAILHGIMLEYGTGAESATASTFTAAAFPALLHAGKFTLKYKGAELVNTGIHHFKRPSENNNNLLNGLFLELNHPKVLEAQQEILAELKFLNAIADVATVGQLVRVSLVVSEFASNVTQ